MINKAKAEYYQNLINNCNGDQGKLFSIVNNLLGRGAKVQLPQATSNAALASTFSDFFIQKIAKLRDDLEKMESSICPMSCPPVSDLLPPPETFLSCFAPVSESEVTEIIKKSKKTSLKQDPMPIKILFDILSAVVPLITEITNRCLSSGYFPKALKSAIVKPLLKKTGLNVDVLKNYRPVSNLSFFSKTIERVIATQLYNHMQKNNLLEEMQSTYKPGHSTETAVI